MKPPWKSLYQKSAPKPGKGKTGHKHLWAVIEKVLTERAPAIWDGQREQAISENEFSTIEAAIKRELPRQFRKAMNILADGFTTGIRSLGWDVPIPDHHHNIRDTPSLYTPDSVETAQEFQRIEDLFLSRLESLWEGSSTTQRIGLLLLSAILYGGLHQKRWLNAWLRSLANPPNIWDDWLWLHLEWRPQDAPKRKRSHRMTSWNLNRTWIADPVTELLMLNWRQHFPDEHEKAKSKFPEALLKAAVEYIGWKKPPGKHLVHSLSEIASSRDIDVLPGFLVEYQSGHLPCTSLPPGSLQRFFTGEVPREELTFLPHTTARQRKHKRVAEETQPSANVEKSIRLIDGLTSFIRHRSQSARAIAGLSKSNQSPWEKITTAKTLKAINSVLRHGCPYLTPAARLLLEWGISLCEKASSPLELRKGSPLAPSSIATYLSLISTGVLENIDTDELRDLTGLEFEILYETVLSYPHTTAQKIRTAERLQQFHGFLTAKFGDISEVDFDEIFACHGLPSKRVKANIITFAEYRVLLKSFGFDRSRRGRWEEIYLVVLILAFRCGLRRSEIHGLQIADIKDLVRAEIRIRPGRFRDPKSVTGNRRIPLYALLPEDELTIVSNWLKKRQREELDHTQPLLQHPETGDSLIPPHRLFDPVVHALRSVTRDTTLSFHSFRHAFATFTLLKLVWPKDLNVKNLPAGLRDESFSLDACTRLAQDLLNNQQQGVRKLHAIAMLLGHAEYGMSFRSYIHLTDWLLAVFKRQDICLPKLTNKALGQLAGLSKQGVFKCKRENPSRSAIFQNQLHNKVQRWGSQWKLKLDSITPTPIMHEKTAEDIFWLPPWAMALGDYLKAAQNNSYLMSPPSGTDATMAKLMYERLKGLKSRRMMFARRVIPVFAELYDVSHGGLVSRNIEHARELRKLFEMVNLSGIRLAAHYRISRSQTVEERDRIIETWSEALGIPKEQVKQKDFGPGKGLVVLKVIQERQSVRGGRVAIASGGWRFVLALVDFQIKKAPYRSNTYCSNSKTS
ncbi:site-specific integrase [Geothermobacter hydrogeniphilus]|nr:site-specific integrase [Geothermobacter hydrogeniphilus]